MCADLKWEKLPVFSVKCFTIINYENSYSILIWVLSYLNGEIYHDIVFW